MASWVPFLMLVLAGFFVGGIFSFAKTKRWGLVAVLAVAAALSLGAAIAWWEPA